MNHVIETPMTYVLNHENPDHSISKLRVTINVENLDGSDQAFRAQFDCHDGEVTITSKEEIGPPTLARDDKYVLPRIRQIDLALKFVGLEYGADLHFSGSQPKQKPRERL
jgi:hypothetical protein